MSRNLSGPDVEAIKVLISHERLGTFRAMTRSDKGAIELHQASMMLSSSLMSVTGVLEIALRNAACTRISADYGVADFLRAPPASLRWHPLEVKKIEEAQSQARRAAYSKLTVQEKEALDAKAFAGSVPRGISHSAFAARRQAVIEVSTGQIISQLTIFFWKRLFSEQYERTLWKRSLKRVFPNKTLMRPAVAEHLEVLYQIRNRLAHHEPVYGRRLEQVIDAIDFVTMNLGARFPDPETPVAKLLMPHRQQLDSQIAIFRSSFARLSTRG